MGEMSAVAYTRLLSPFEVRGRRVMRNFVLSVMLLVALSLWVSYLVTYNMAAIYKDTTISSTVEERVTQQTKTTTKEGVLGDYVPLVKFEKSHPNRTRNSQNLIADLYDKGFSVSLSTKCRDKGAKLTFLGIIISAPAHFAARAAIRHTWGSYGDRRDILFLFLVGGTSNETLEQQLAEEEEMFGDVIRSNCYDLYENLTLKTMAMLEWTISYCAHIKYLLKIDDDMFLNVPNLLQLIATYEVYPRQIYGRLGANWPVIRKESAKYHVPKELYAPDRYPNFVTGPAYLLSADILEELLMASLKHPYFMLEDVLLNGIVADKLGIKRNHVTAMVNKRIEFTTCAIKKVISIHNVAPTEQFDLWNKQLGVQEECPLEGNKYFKIVD